MLQATIRLATLDDLPRIVDIYNSTIAGRMVTADLDPITVESRLPWFHAHQPARRPLWVAERDGKVIAWVSLSDFYGRPAYNATAEVSIYLDESVRGQGLGRDLLQYVIDTAPQYGVKTCFASWAHLPEVASLDGVARDLIILGRKL